jgi:hypothetical protein
MNDDNVGYYVYLIGATRLLAELDGLPGIDDAPVTPVTHERLSALTSVVGLDAFSAAQQAREVSETGWLAQAVRAHERVALHALECGPVLPMRFGTVYPNSADVGTLLQRHQASLLGELDRVAGAAEWSLKVSVAEPAPGVDQASDTGSGTAWLLARQAALHAHQQRADRLSDCVERLRTELGPRVRDIAVSRPLDGATDAVRMWLLVDDVERLHAAYEPLREHQHAAGFALQLTGPWPPYHFVRTDALHDADAVAQP